MQDAVQQDNNKVNYESANIQPNDILKISVESTMPEAAIPYNYKIIRNLYLKAGLILRYFFEQKRQ